MAVQVTPPIIQAVRAAIGRPTSGDQLTLLWLIATACEQNLPLAPAVEALSADARGMWQGRLEDFASVLRKGTEVDQAIECVPGLLPPKVVLAAKMGAETDTLGPALRVAAEWQAKQHADANGASLGGAIFYLASIVILLTGFILYTKSKILPRYMDIFGDFGVELPKITMSLVNLAEDGLLLMVPLLAIAGLFPLLWLLWSSGARYQFLSLNRFLPRLDIGPVLQQLGVVVDGGKSLTEGLKVLSTQHPNSTTWKRLSFVFEGVSAGGNCWDLMENQKLLRPRERQLLESAERTGNLGWALQMLGQQIERKQDVRGYALMQFVKPIGLCILGGFVAFVAIAMMAPMIKVISDLG